MDEVQWVDVATPTSFAILGRKYFRKEESIDRFSEIRGYEAEVQGSKHRYQILFRYDFVKSFGRWSHFREKPRIDTVPAPTEPQKLRQLSFRPFLETVISSQMTYENFIPLWDEHKEGVVSFVSDVILTHSFFCLR